MRANNGVKRGDCMSDCKGCVREKSNNIIDHLHYCQYCNRNDNQEFHRDLYILDISCNLTTCRYNENCKCTNEEKRKECVEVSRKVLCEDESKRKNNS